jgi:hypothetical protein
MVLIKELYNLGTRNDIEDKYLEFRVRLPSAFTLMIIVLTTLTELDRQPCESQTREGPDFDEAEPKEAPGTLH